MKRKNYTTKISNLLENNISSKILFSNKLNLGDNNSMNATAKGEIQIKTVVLNGREYDLFNHTLSDAIDFLEHARRGPEITRLPKQLEDIVALYPNPAVFYAAEVLERRWPEVEDMMLKTADDALQYAEFVINGFWHEAEDIISTDPQASIEYAYLIKRRFIKGEKTIINSKYLPDYIKLLTEDYKEFAEEYKEYVI